MRAAGSLHKKTGPPSHTKRRKLAGGDFLGGNLMETATYAKLPAVLEQAVILQKIDLNKVNFMLPSQTFGQDIGKFDRVSLEVVQVDPNPKKGDVYEVADGKFALSKIPLQRISSAISIQWVPSTTGIMECTDTISRGKATGIMRKPNGDLITVTDEKTIDMNSIEEELRFKAEEKAEKGNPEKIKAWGKTKNDKSYPIFEPWASEEERERWIVRKVRIGCMEKRKFKNELAMTGAVNRVIRRFVAIKSSYTAEEIARPFVFPRIAIDTGKMLNDPKLAAAAIGLLAGSTTTVFGPKAGAAVEQANREAEKIFDQEAGPVDGIEDAVTVPDDPFADVMVPEPVLTPEEARRKKVVDALMDYVASEYLDDEKKTKVQAFLDDKTTPIETLEKYCGLCKLVEEKKGRVVK
jgi:hypothetical protein